MDGTPVLTSFNSSLKEFAGPGVFHFDPGDRDALDRAYARLRAAAPIAIEPAPLRARYSWEGLAGVVSEMATTEAR